MIRVVLDTNVIVSTHLRSGGLPEAVLNLCLKGFLQLCVSEADLAEYREVLLRPRLKIDPQKALDSVARINDVAVMVHPMNPISACVDPDDNMFLECAQSGDADSLITGNLHDFPQIWEKTQIVSAREFLEKKLGSRLV